MRLRVLPAVLLLAALAGCSIYGDPAQNEANIISPTNFLAGTGEIYSVGVVSGKTPTLYRLFLRTDKGHQAVDIDKGNFLAGEWVELTNDGRVVRLSGTSLNRARE